MSSGLPVRIQVRKAVARKLQLEGTLEPSRLTRLQGLLLGHQGDVHAQIAFGRGLDGHDCIRGRVTGDLILQCQRCLGEMPHHLEADLDIRLVSKLGPGESRPDGNFEGIEITDDELLLHEILEDEMILALPTVPMHEDAGHCEQGKVPQDYLRQEKSDESNPFAVLAKLKSNPPSTR